MNLGLKALLFLFVIHILGYINIKYAILLLFLFCAYLANIITAKFMPVLYITPADKLATAVLSLVSGLHVLALISLQTFFWVFYFLGLYFILFILYMVVVYCLSNYVIMPMLQQKMQSESTDDVPQN